MFNLFKRHKDWLKRNGGMQETQDSIKKAEDAADAAMRTVNNDPLERRWHAVPVDFERRSA